MSSCGMCQHLKQLGVELTLKKGNMYMIDGSSVYIIVHVCIEEPACSSQLL